MLANVVSSFVIINALHAVVEVTGCGCGPTLPRGMRRDTLVCRCVPPSAACRAVESVGTGVLVVCAGVGSGQR